MEDVGLEAVRVLGPALGGAPLVAHGAQPRHGDGGGHGGPHPRRRHHAQDLAQLEVGGHGLRDGVVLVHADVHQRVDGGHQAEAVEPAVDGAEGAVAEDPAPFDQCGDGQRHDGRPDQQVGHGQVDEEEVGASAHAPVADDDGQHHGVAHDGQEGRDGQQGGQDDGEGEVPAVVLVVLVLLVRLRRGVGGVQRGHGRGGEAQAVVVIHRGDNVMYPARLEVLAGTTRDQAGGFG